MNPQRIVIIGAGLAGATAAVTLRDEGFDGEIQLIGAEPQLPYNRPPLSKGYLRGEERLEDQLVNPPGIYAEKSIRLGLGTRVTAIDATKKHVEVEDGERIAYDRLLVATGGRNRSVSIPGAELDGVLQLRTVEESDRIRTRAQRRPRRRALPHLAARCLRRRRRDQSPASDLRPSARGALEQWLPAGQGRRPRDAGRHAAL